MIIYYYCS